MVKDGGMGKPSPAVCDTLLELLLREWGGISDSRGSMRDDIGTLICTSMYAFTYQNFVSSTNMYVLLIFYILDKIVINSKRQWNTFLF